MIHVHVVVKRNIKNVVDNRKTSTLVFEGDSVQVYFRYRIMMNDLK